MRRIPNLSISNLSSCLIHWSMFQLREWINTISVGLSAYMMTSRRSNSKFFERTVKKDRAGISHNLRELLLARTFSTTLPNQPVVSTRWMLVTLTTNICLTQIHSKTCSNIHRKWIPSKKNSTSANLTDSQNWTPLLLHRSMTEKITQHHFTPHCCQVACRLWSMLVNSTWRMECARP